MSSNQPGSAGAQQNYKVRTYNAIAVKGLDKFPRELYEVASEITHPDAFLLRSQKLHDEEFPQGLKAIARAGAGVNNVPVDRCSKVGIVVFNTPGANANAVKELVLAGLLLTSRGISQGNQFSQGLDKSMDASAMAALVEKQKKQFKGSEIAGKTLGVVGLGAIGSMVANMAVAMGMKVIGFDPAISVEAAWRLSSEVGKMENLPSLLARSDFVSIHVPALDVTHHLINSDALKAAKPGLRLLNFAREEVVDTAAAIAALDSGQMEAYASDFPVPELIGRDDVFLTPHIGASTEEAEENCAVMAAEQLRDFLENGNIKNSVNFPLASMERTAGAARLTFSNENVAGVLGNVLSVLANQQVNVIDMLNKSRDELAYNILDVEGPVSSEILADINEVDHVINVRLI